MKIRKAVQWMFFGVVWNLSAQNNYSADFKANSMPSESIKINEVHFGLYYNKTFQSKYKIDNELEYNSKEVDYPNTDFSNSLTSYNELRNKFTVSYLMNKKMIFNFELEPYIASENNLKVSDIDLLGELNVDLILNSNKKLTVGASRNNFFGKTMILPVFSYYYEYSKKLNLSIGFPESKMNYSNNIRNVFSLKNAFNGSLYRLEDSFKALFFNSTNLAFHS